MDSALTEEMGLQILIGTRDFSSLQNVQTGCVAHPSYSMGTGPRPEFGHTSASSAGVKNECSCTVTPPICFQGVEKNFILIHHFGEILTVCMPSLISFKICSINVGGVWYSICRLVVIWKSSLWSIRCMKLSRIIWFTQKPLIIQLQGNMNPEFVHTRRCSA